MAVETKEILEYLGLKADDVKDLDTFKTKFDTDFIKQSNITEDLEPVKKILGKTFGTLENEIKKVAKNFELDVDFNSEDLKGKKVTEKLNFVVSEYANKQKAVISELESKVGQGNDEKVKELEEKYKKAVSKAKDYENLLNTTKTDYETFQQNTEKEKKNIKLDFFKSQALAKVKFKADINEYEKEGYISKIEKSLVFDLDENGKLIVLNKDGKRIPSTKQTGAFMEAEEVLQEEAVKGGLFKLNPDAGTKKPNQYVPLAKPEPVPTGRKVAQRL